VLFSLLHPGFGVERIFHGYYPALEPPPPEKWHDFAKCYIILDLIESLGKSCVVEQSESRAASAEYSRYESLTIKNCDM